VISEKSKVFMGLALRWRVESGEWRVESGEWRVESYVRDFLSVSTLHF
jgi:hypothetical protein